MNRNVALMKLQSYKATEKSHKILKYILHKISNKKISTRVFCNQITINTIKSLFYMKISSEP